MLRHLPRTAALLTAAGVALLSPGTASAGAADTAGPTIRTEAAPRFAVGTDVSYDYLRGYIWTVELHWAASDPSGVCKQAVNVQSYDDMGAGRTIQVDPAATSFRYNDYTLNYGRVTTTFRVIATDCAGNRATGAPVQEQFDVTQDTDSGITYSGTWRESHFSRYLGRTTHVSTARHAAAELVVRGGPVGLVMPRSDRAGRFDVYVDGIRTATVDNYTPAGTTFRTVVWSTLLPGGPDSSHTLRIENRATPGHGRIDLDAVLQ